MISVEFHQGAEAETSLAREMFDQLGYELPDGEAAEEALGYLAARRDGRLLGYARLLAEGKVAEFDVSLVARTRFQLDGVGRSDEEEDTEVITELLRAATGQVAGLGCDSVRWTGIDRLPEGRAAKALHATEQEELGRHWGTTDLPGWQRPTELPDRSVRMTVDEELVTAETDAVRLTAFLDEHTALVECPEHEDAPTAEVAGVVAELAGHLRRDHPEVTELLFREFDDEVLREAMGAAGLSVVDRWLVYRLPAQVS